MKVIYMSHLWVVVGDDWNGLVLESLTDPPVWNDASYSSEDLIVDPTDPEVAALPDSGGDPLT